MKKLVSFALILISLFTATTVTAQKEAVTSVTATKDKGYTVLNAKEPIVIYKLQPGALSPKEPEKNAPKYFFTTASSNVLQDLTISNLKQAFPNNHSFHDALDANFKEDKELTAYDNFHKMYKIDRIYISTVKQ
jgi:hypothetical protein